MKSWKLKILLPLILVTVFVGVYFFLWHFPVSNGKRVGNLTKISKKGKFWFTKTWEGTLDEGSGEQLTSHFSVRNEEVANELFNYEGRQVIIYYEQYMVNWPWETTYDVTSWKPKGSDEVQATVRSIDEKMMDYMGKTLFCSLLGSLYQEQELYNRVKDYIKANNLYLYKQFKTCNE